MKHTAHHSLRWIPVALLIACHGLLIPASHAQSPALVNYQGRLVDGTNLVNGSVGLTLRMFDAPSGGTLLYADSNAVTVVDGLYATYIGDGTIFGDLDTALTNAQVWLEVQVNGTTLSPRERLVSVPYARAVRGLRVVNNSTIVLNAEAGSNVVVQSTHATIAGGTGNAIGTNSFGSAIGGGNDNSVSNNSRYATIAGGGGNVIGAYSYYSAIGGGMDNNVGAYSQYTTIAGGSGNKVGSDSYYSTIGGGSANSVLNESGYATIAGGFLNDIGDRSDYSVIGGGARNSVGASNFISTIAGGNNNNIGVNSSYSAIGGGRDNIVGSNSAYSTISGGRNNATGPNATNAFAAGRRAKANHRGTFVWGDDTNADVASTNINQVTFRASGGFRIFSNSGMTLGVTLNPNATAWSAISDRDAKENIVPLDPQGVLDGVRQLPLSSWNYKADPSERRYIGPMSQDFHALFGLGDDKTINTLDADGVLFAAVQALAKENEEVKKQNEELRNELEAIKRHLGL